MKLKWVHIKNYRSCKDVRIDFGPMHAIVGANNAGKSSILRALDFLFNPSKGKIDEEAFWNGNTEEQIWIEGFFDDLTAQELANDKLRPYLTPENTFHIARSASVVATEEGSSADDKIAISQHYCTPVPKYEWLQTAKIIGKNIDDWWSNPDSLKLDNGTSFAEYVGNKKPRVGEWKAKSEQFMKAYSDHITLATAWADNPQGYSGVLKGTLPHFIFVPAVKEASDEAKVTKTNPFGQILYKILESVSSVQKETIEGILKTVEKQLNRSGGDERIDSIRKTETRLNQLLGDYMSCDLEIEFQSPTIETLITSPQLFANDGYRNIISNKGHGLQRAIIFSILRCYSEQVTGIGVEKKKPMIFAVEEPELYMHPQAQRSIRRAFRAIADGGDQVLFTTHSSLLVDVAYFDEVVRMESKKLMIEGKERLSSKAWQLSMDKMLVDIKTRISTITPTDSSIRELYAHAYHPNRSEGFFAKKVLLVEGATEQYTLPIYADACKHYFDMLNISVVDCGGKGQMDRLYRVFNELGIPCYLLFDYDKSNPDKNIIKKSKELLSLIGENTDLNDAITIKDKYAYFPNTWETDLREETQNIETLTAEARELLGLQKDSGKPLVARYIAKKLTSEETPIVPESIKGIIEKAVSVKWEKSCLETPEQ